MKKRDRTLATHAGNNPKANKGVVNPPVYHASTILYDSVADMRGCHKNRFTEVYYGRYGTPTTFALEEAVAALEEADRAVAVPSGLGAVAGALLSFLSSGDHVLMVDSTYEPSRTFCDNHLKRFCVETTYYDPAIGAGIADLIRPNTKVVYLESPGSHTFEIQDVPAIAAAAHARGCVVILDNTWASPLYFKPYRHGVDVVVHAATKYIVGHSDVMMGIITMRDEYFERVKSQVHGMGFAVGGDDCYLALRGLRTIGVRLAQHQETALALAKWLQGRPEVERVLHPALPDHPSHALWKRDFLGSTGLFGVVLKPASDARVAAMIDGMDLFGLGFSWGGYESLMVPTNVANARTATKWQQPGPTVRIHAGLEDTDDLIEDLARGLDRLRGN